ncbi:MAG: hypothetical protein K6T26_03560 [Alicyclobacillus sp.]|nr:hypothetical protein [Alicyclobacillus sp.]
MQWQTFVKFGSLAFEVAQDQKVRELAGLVHRGAKRRGLLGPPPRPPATGNQSPAAHAQSANGGGKGTEAKPAGHPIPFAPAAPTTSPVQGHSAAGQVPWSQWINRKNAKKAMALAGELVQWLTR